MIKVTRMDGKEIILNGMLIELVEATPDTVISLTTGRKVLVREDTAEVVARVKAFYRELGGVLTVPASIPPASSK